MRRAVDHKLPPIAASDAQLPARLIAQSVRALHRYRRVIGSNPVQTFFNWNHLSWHLHCAVLQMYRLRKAPWVVPFFIRTPLKMAGFRPLMFLAAPFEAKKSVGFIFWRHLCKKFPKGSFFGGSFDLIIRPPLCRNWPSLKNGTTLNNMPLLKFCRCPFSLDHATANYTTPWTADLNDQVF